MTFLLGRQIFSGATLVSGRVLHSMFCFFFKVCFTFKRGLVAGGLGGIYWRKRYAVYVRMQKQRWIYCTHFCTQQKLKAERHQLTIFKQKLERFSPSEIQACIMCFFSRIPPSVPWGFYGKPCEDSY